jgi:hypothetical protein
VRLLDDYQQAEKELSETFLKLRVVWLQTETQMSILRKIWQTLPPDHQQTQLSLFSVLETKVHRACLLLDDIIGTTSTPGSLNTMNRFRYAAIKKKDLSRSVAKLIEWHQLFNVAWCLLARVPGHKIDQNLEMNSKDAAVKLLIGLRKSVKELSSEDNAPSREISSHDFLESQTLIMASGAATAQFQDRTEYAIVDAIMTNPKIDAAATTRSVRALTKALSRSEPASFGLLRCCGVINKTTKYEFVFKIPPGLSNKPRSLRDLLLNCQPPLDEKLDIAKQLANSVFHLHAMGFVHKNIRPDSTIIFDSGNEKATFLVGFENYRTTSDDTFFTGDERPERELYRHPSRQGSNPQRRYVMQHDIYSLGVCLLEIGLWRSFINMREHEAVFDLGIDTQIDDPTRKANAIKKKLLIMVDEQLPQLVGGKFTNVVKKCLTWLDKEKVDRTGAPEGEIGFEFIDHVLLPLREIIV